MQFALVVFIASFLMVGVHCQSSAEKEKLHRHLLEHEEHEEHHNIFHSGEEHHHHHHHHDEEWSHRFYVEKMIDYYLKDSNTKWERECFGKFKKTDSIDIVLDIAPSPALDKVDKTCAESPVGLFLERGGRHHHRSPSYTYFKSIAIFIDAVTLDMKPENTHTVIYENGRKFYIRGKDINETLVKEQEEFNDMARNLKTLWPVDTKSCPETYLSKILRNNLGRMTKLALWSRDNGLATVLHGSRRSKPIYTIVISDGASGAKIEDLTDDLTRTTVIDVGNHRFIKNLKWDQIRQIVSLVPLTAPQALPAMIDSVRHMACLLSTHETSD